MQMKATSHGYMVKKKKKKVILAWPSLSVHDVSETTAFPLETTRFSGLISLLLGNYSYSNHHAVLQCFYSE